MKCPCARFAFFASFCSRSLFRAHNQASYHTKEKEKINQEKNAKCEEGEKTVYGTNKQKANGEKRPSID